MKTNVVSSENYAVVKEFKIAFNPDQFNEKVVQILFKYDFIVGDYADGQLRLKGFYYNRRRDVNPFQKEGFINRYLSDYCNYMCPHFIVEKISQKQFTKPSRPKPKRRPRIVHEPHD